MKTNRTLPGLLGALLCAIALALPATAGEPTTVRFQDTGKPGTLRIQTANAKLRIAAGAEAGLVRVSSNEAPPKDKTPPRDDGLRVLGDTEAAFTLSVSGNTATLNSASELWGETGIYEITVPADTAVQIQNNWGGEINVTGLTGDLSIQGMNSDVTLERMSGATNIEILNGKVTASYLQISDNKPISISSMNGPVVLRVPEAAKASVRFRTHNGAILTDFTEAVLKTRSENLGNTNWGAFAGKHAAMAARIANNLGREIGDQAKNISEEVREAVKEAREDIRQAAEEAKEKAESLKNGEQDAQAVAGEKPAANTLQPPPIPEAPKTGAGEKAPRAPKPPRAPVSVHIPALSGGKMVSGDLNGGGTSIQVTLMNGDVTFRKLKD